MSLKDLLPPGTYGEIVAQAHDRGQKAALTATEDGVTICRCPNCGKETVYSVSNPFRPFCSEKCKILDLGAWASEQRTVAGPALTDDEDADLLNDPTVPKRHLLRE